MDFINQGGIVASCYYDTQTSGQSDTGKGTPQTTSAMQRQVTFTGWDFTDVWKIHEGTSYPYFVEVNTISKETFGVRPYCLYGKGSVNLSTGNFILAQTDLCIPSVGPSLEFTRFYNSQDDYTGTQGKGWTNNFNVHLTINQDGSVSVAYDDGHVYTFTYDGTSYVRPAGCFETLTAGPGSGYTLTFKDQTGYIFNDIGQLTSITDQNNNTLTLTYTGGLLTLASEPTGRTLSFNYDTNNRLTGVTDTAGRTVTYTYDNEGNLATVQDVLGNVTSYHYNTQGLTEIIASGGNTLLSNIYDSGKVTHQTDGSGNTTQFSYDPDNHRTTMLSALGNTITTTFDEKYRSTNITYPGNITGTYTYDINNCLTSITDPLNHTTSYTYDGNGNLLTVTDPASHTTTMEYDDNNNLLLVENALEKQSTFTYDSNGNLIKTTDSLGNETLYNYDESGLLLSTTTPDTGLGSGTTIYTYQNGLMQTVTDPAENTTTYSYNAAGQPITITDNAGKTSAMTYDDAGNLLTVADPLGNTTSYTYDWRGNILTKTDARGNTSSYTYNNNGLLVSKIDALNNETGYEYDAENRLVKVTDPRGNITQLSYDDLGRLTGVTNPLGDTITNQYDAAGNLIGRIDALGNQVLTVTYDELYNPKNMTDALGNNVSFDEYDELNRLTRFTDPGGNITQFEYDDLNRLKSTIDALTGQGRQEFDAHGNRTAMVDPNNNQTSFSYDNADRLTGRTTAASGNITLTYNNRDLIAQKINARGQSTTYEYDDAGRLISATYPDGTVSYTYDQNSNLLSATDSTGTIEYQYDALNRLVEYGDTWGNTIEYAYDAIGNLRILTYPGGRQVQYQYDETNRLIQVTDWADRVTTYEYDSNGRLVKTVHPNGTQTTRTYDEAGRLLQLKDVDAGGSVISQYDYTYDAAGNLIQEENFNENVSLTMDDAALTYATDNRLATYNGQTVLYDADGNMTAGPLAGEMAGLTYDARGRLTGAGNTTYTYDAGNNRISVAGAVYQSFVVNPNASLSQVLIQTDEQNHQTFYIYGLGLIGQEDEGGVYRSYHFDHRGSTIALTDESGNITDRFQYAPYGELVYRSGNTATPFLYVGRYGVMTDESDLYYMRARYYNPVAKRFLSPDTLTGQVTNPQSQNRYIYCEGNPVNFIDPSGHDWIRAQYFMSELAGLHYDDLYDVYKNLEEDISYDGWSQSDLEDLTLQFRIANELLIIRGDPVYYDQDEKDEAKITLAGIMDEENEKEEQKLLLASILVMGRTIGYDGSGKAGSKVPSQLLRGMDFEEIVLQEQAITKNLTKIGNSIPDSLINGRIIEVKDVNYIYKNKQFRDYINSGMPIDLIVSPRTKISKPLQDAIRNSGGSIRVRQADGTYSIY
ncbi:DUF6531 domain-containing protein [Pelotomaculum schinkii]|uniref:DUF6531 domain-containing protein n=1 Tax=Pelotomaculum schinkii TaxID=78350 RepID=UPI00167DD264|nr:RHS repeat-associated core domain-containing protein [Pelotomaculum schinkii]